MAISDAFERGLGIGEKYGKFSSIRDAIKSVVDKYNQQEELTSTYGTKAVMDRAFADPLDRQIKEAELKYKTAQTDVADTQRNIFSKMGQGGEGIPGYQLESIDTPFGTLKRKPSIEELRKDAAIKRESQGIPSGEIGKVALAQESIKNIDDIKKILFPTGEAKSFKRGVALGSNVPGATAPLIGAVIPERAPFANKNMQDVFRKMGSALSGRQLIQTGVAARPEETIKLVNQYAPNVFSNPESSLQGLNELQEFYKNYLNTVSTRSADTTYDMSIPEGVSPDDWNAATPEQKQDLLDYLGR